jgi:hypothetical protein
VEEVELCVLEGESAMELERSEECEVTVKEPMNEKDSVLESIAAPTVAGLFHYAVIVSEFNSFITDQLLRGALRTLK